MSKKTGVFIIALLAVQTLLIGGLIFSVANITSGNSEMSKTESESRLNQIEIGIQCGYVNNLFGEPIYRADIDGMDITYYKLDGVALRVDYDNGGAAVGYLITVMDERVWDIESYAFFANGGTLGSASYSDLETAAVKVNRGGNSLGQVYYAEYSNASTYTNGNYLVQAYMPYGHNSGSDELIFIADDPEKHLDGYEPGSSLLENAVYNEKRGNHIPNSYGVFRYEPTTFAFSNDVYSLLAGDAYINKA